MQLNMIVCFYSGINNVTFLLLYKGTLCVKLLQTFRQTVRVSLSKEQSSKTLLPLKVKSQFFFEKSGKPLHNDKEV